MEPEETIYVTSTSVNCDGGGGPLGHPSVYLKIGKEGAITCPYCSRHYVLSEDAAPATGH